MWGSIWFWAAVFASVFGGIIFREKLRQSQACLEVGKQISSEEFLAINPNGYQDSLSDPRHNLPFFLAAGLIIAAPIIGFQEIGWSALWFILFSLVCGMIYKGVTSKKDVQSYYLPIIYADFAKKEQKYISQGDNIRAIAARDVKQKLEESYPELDFLFTQVQRED
jgi:hypothetical protein